MNFTEYQPAVDTIGRLVSQAKGTNEVSKNMIEQIESSVQILRGCTHDIYFQDLLRVEKDLGEIFDIVDKDQDSVSRVKWGSIEPFLACLQYITWIREVLSCNYGKKYTQGYWSSLTSASYLLTCVSKFSKEAVGGISQKQLAHFTTLVNECWKTYTHCLTEFSISSEGKLTTNISDILSILGVQMDAIQQLKIDENFYGLLQHSKHTIQIADFLESLLVCCCVLKLPELKGLGELSLCRAAATKYRLKGYERVGRSASLWLIRRADGSLGLWEEGHEYPEELNLIKTAMQYLDPTSASLADKLGCLISIRTGNMKELLRYKQFLNLSNAGDALFDILMDIYRFAHNVQPSVSLQLLVHKLKSPFVSELVSAPMLSGFRHYFKGDAMYPFILICQEYLPQSSLVYFQCMSEWLTEEREKCRTSQGAAYETAKKLTELNWTLADSSNSSSHADCNQDQLRYFILRCVYQAFYCFKMIEDRQKMSVFGERLLLLCDGQENMWKVAEQNGDFFLDLLDVISDGSGDGKESLKQFLEILAKPESEDTTLVRAYKSLMRVRISLSNKEEVTENLEFIFKQLTIEQIYSGLKGCITSPEVYYPFFFTLFSSYLGNSVETVNAEGLFRLLIHIYEQNEKLNDGSAASNEVKGSRSLLPVICERSYPLLCQLHGESRMHIGHSLSVFLYNIWTDSKEFSVLKLSFDFGGGVRGKEDCIIGVFLLQAAKNKEALLKEQKQEVCRWLEEQLSRSVEIGKELYSEISGLSYQQLVFLAFAYEVDTTCLGEVSPDSEIFSIVLLAAKETSPTKYSSLLRQYLSKLVSQTDPSLPFLFSIYSHLLLSTDSCREIKLYLNQLERVLQIGKPPSLLDIESLLPALAIVMRDFGSTGSDVKAVLHRLKQSASDSHEQNSSIKKAKVERVISGLLA